MAEPREDAAAEPTANRLVVFGEEIVLDPPLPELLTEIEVHLLSLATKYGPSATPEMRFELLDTALDELDRALERVRQARATLARIEIRLITAHERALGSLRAVERERER